MSELIDRQAAITALTFAKETGTMKCGELKGVIEVLNRLPSAGPTFDARDTQYNLPIGTDLISRAQAIAMCRKPCMRNADCSDFEMEIMMLPSAEPKTGKWRHYEGMLTCSECASEFYDTIIEFCGDDVPHFCPDCGAKMREVTT